MDLETRFTRIEAIREIENLMGLNQYYFSVGKFDDVPNLFAQNTPGVSFEASNHGLCQGIENIKKYQQGHKANFGSDGEGTGWFAEAISGSSVIQVAKDGKTAKGLWSQLGLRGFPDKESAETGQVNAEWGCFHVSGHFILEDGQWKIYKLHIYPVFVTPYEKGWGKVQWPVPVTKEESTTYWRPYNPANKPECIPAAPEPYDTYAPDTPLP